MRVKTITCPNCAHANNFLAEDCTQCGIHFSRYYEELEKAETLRHHIEAQEKAEALRREQEEQERREAEARQQEAEEKAEAQRRKQEEQEGLQAEARRQEEEERQRREEENRRQAEEQKRIEDERHHEAQKRADILKRQKEELEKAEALKRQKEAMIEDEDVDPAEREAQAGAFDYIEYPPESAPSDDPPDTPDAHPGSYRPAATLEERLRIYEGRMVGLTYGHPAEIQNVKLLAVSRDHFQVFYPISRNIVSFAYRVILSITENAEGLSAVGPDISPVFPVVVELPRPFFHAN